MRDIIRRSAIGIGQGIRTGWMIVGISLAFLLIAESCYRAEDALRTSFANARAGTPRRAGPRPEHPVASRPWYPEFAAEFKASQGQTWRPWVYFRRAQAYHGKYVNIDSLHHRITPQPTTPATPAARVFLFGGSTMWGSFLRDDHTIPAEASRRLQALAGPDGRIEVTNLGETGHVSTQGLIELILQLRAGNRPDVVVFYDGINDGFSVLQNGEAGVGMNEVNRVNEFTLGRKLAWNDHPEGVAKNLHSLAVLSAEAMTRLKLVQRLRRIVDRQSARALPSADSAARSVARVYSENMRIVESLARTYGFTAVYVWQPTIHGTRKQLTPFEAQLMASIKQDPLQARLRQVHLIVPSLLDTLMASVAPGRFVNASSAFERDTLPVFSDQIGHNTEEAIPPIVDTFWPVLRTAVSAKLAKAKLAGDSLRAARSAPTTRTSGSAAR